MCCARAVCAKNQCSEFVLVIKIKKCSNVQWRQACALKASLKTSVLAASIIDSGSSFHSWEKSFIHIYIGPATSIYKFKWVVISCLAFLLFKVIWNFYCRGASYDLVQVC